MFGIIAKVILIVGVMFGIISTAIAVSCAVIAGQIDKENEEREDRKKK